MQRTFASMTLAQLQEWYNQKCEQNEIRAAKRGSGDIEIMRKRCLDLYNVLINREKEERTMARKAKGAAAAAETNTETTTAEGGESQAAAANTNTEDKVRGRKSAYSGQRLWYVHEENKRQAGSWGNKSMGIIIAEPGITYEKFVKEGGRTVDLAWDVKRDNVVFAEEAVLPMREKLAATKAQPEQAAAA
jgi:hypothetical protein